MRAREIGLDILAQRTVEDATNVAPEMAQSARLTYDARRWYLSKLAPMKYGDKLEIESRSVTIELNPPSDRERVRAFAGLLARVKGDPDSGGDGSPV
jgi:hypothetical protein